MIRTLLAALALTAFACGSSDSKTVDAATGGPDAPACTGAVYDPCTDPSQCTSGLCHTYMGSALEVCTATCSGAMACPNQATTAVACNAMGNCKPPAANVCAR